MKFSSIILSGIVLVSNVCAAEHPDHPEHPEHPEHPTSKKVEVSVQAVGKAVAEFVASDANLKGGKFLVFDITANEVLELDLVKIHMDRLTGVGNDTYFACADI